MLPLEIIINGSNINLELLGGFIFFALFIFGYWLVAHSDRHTLVVFDVVFFSLSSALFFSRVLAALNNSAVYFAQPAAILNILDGAFMYVGVFTGLLCAALIISQFSSIESDLKQLLSRIAVSYALAVIPLVLLVLAAGKMQGIAVSEGAGILYDDGIVRMPINLFRVGYNLLFVIIWTLLRHNKQIVRALGSIYLVIFGVIEFILRIFNNAYEPAYFNAFDLQQLVAIFAVLVGLLSYFGIVGAKVAPVRDSGEPESILERRQMPMLSRGEGISPKERFSLSYSSIQDSPLLDKLSLREKMTVIIKTFKRRVKK